MLPLQFGVTIPLAVSTGVPNRDQTTCAIIFRQAVDTPNRRPFQYSAYSDLPPAMHCYRITILHCPADRILRLRQIGHRLPTPLGYPKNSKYFSANTGNCNCAMGLQEFLLQAQNVLSVLLQIPPRSNKVLGATGTDSNHYDREKTLVFRWHCQCVDFVHRQAE